LVGAGRFNLLSLAFAGAIGSTIGSLLTYGIGYYGGRPLIRRYGHLIFLSERELLMTERFFDRFGHYWSTFLGRVLPVVRTFISIPAGIGKVKIIPFTLAAFIGSFIWSYFLAWLGLKLGEHWNNLEQYFRKFDLVIVIVIVFSLIYWVIRHIKNRV
jgi:membrane protein DedA with SNARE-associated domain